VLKTGCDLVKGLKMRFWKPIYFFRSKATFFHRYPYPSSDLIFISQNQTEVLGEYKKPLTQKSRQEYFCAGAE